MKRILTITAVLGVAGRRRCWPRSPAGAALAHTESDFVAVPAGRPSHDHAEADTRLRRVAHRRGPHPGPVP